MRILFILPSLLLGGLERAQVALANALVNRGYDVTIIILNNIIDLKDELDKRVSVVYKPDRPHKIMKRIPYIRHKFYDDGMWETRASAKTLYKYYVGNEKYDVEIGFFRGLPIKIISGSTNRTAKKFAFVHSDFMHCRGITNNFKNLEDTKKAYSKFDKIICVSNQAMNSFNTVVGLKNKTMVINNIIRKDRISKLANESIDIKKERFTILSVGRLTYAKGYDRLLRVIKKLNEENLDFDLWLVGYGEDERVLKNYANESKLDNVKFLGSQSNPYKYMRVADLYVCSSYFEGFPLTVSEAVLLEMPVLSTDCSGSNEILANGEYGVIVDNSEDGLYNGIRRFINERSLIDIYRNKAITRKPFFDEAHIVFKIEQLFNGENYNGD